MINENEKRLRRYFFRGKNSVTVHYKSDTEVTVKIGSVHLNNGSIDDIFEVLEEFDVDVGTPTADTWCYVMVDVPSQGKVITSDDITIVEDEPSLDEEKLGYYSGDGLSRCIGTFRTDGSSDVKEFYIIGSQWRIAGQMSMIGNESDVTWASFTWDVPFDDLLLSGAILGDWVNNWNIASYGWTDFRHLQGLPLDANSRDNSLQTVMPADGKTGYYGMWQSTSDTMSIRFDGFLMFPYLFKP